MSWSAIKRTVLTIGAAFLFAHGLAAYTLRDRMMTREVPDSACTLPSPASIFPTSADRANIWFLLDSVVSSDAFTVEWLDPSGSLHLQQNWNSHSGTGCYSAWLRPQTAGLSSGTWTVRIKANGSPLFSLTFRLVPPSEACPTGTITASSSTRAALSESDCRVGDILMNSDMRYARRYRFSLSNSGVFRADLASSDFDSFLILLDANGTLIDDDDDGGSGQDSKIVRQLDPGDYTLLVTSYRKATGAFRLTTSWQDPSACGVTGLELGGVVFDALRSTDCPLTAFLPDRSPGAYARQFRLVVHQPGELVIDLISTAFDPYLFLLDSRYGLLESNDDGGSGQDSKITRRLQPGVYYIVATSYAAGSTGRFGLVTDFKTGSETITLYLHGLNSESGTWDKLNQNEYSGQCLKIAVGTTGSDDVPLAPCYLYTFRARVAPGNQVWPHGDGATYSELGEEVGVIAEWIRSRHNLKVLILAGHSRGGLAARAYLQSLDQRLPFRVGLVTVGTPHLGSPFGRIQWWLRDNVFLDPMDLPQEVRFVFSPSTGYLATSHDRSNIPSVDDPVSQAIRDLNATASRLPLRADLLGEVTSAGLKFGENVFGRLDVSTLIGVIATDAERQTLLDYIQMNLPEDWLNFGDGVVPFESQQVLKVPGVSGRVWYIDLKSKTSHTDETSRTSDIKAVVDKVSSELGAMSPLSVPSPPAPVSAVRAPHPVPAANRPESKQLRELGARLPSTWATTVDQAESALHTNDSERLYALGRQTLESSSRASDPASQLGLHLLRLAATEKAVDAAFASLTTERGWTSGSTQSIAAEFALLPFERTGEALINTLRRSSAESPAAAAAASTLAQSGEPAAVRALLHWARSLAEPESSERAARCFRQIASTKAIAEFRKLIQAEPFTDELVSQALQSVLAEINVEPMMKEIRQ